MKPTTKALLSLPKETLVGLGAEALVEIVLELADEVKRVPLPRPATIPIPSCVPDPKPETTPTEPIEQSPPSKSDEEPKEGTTEEEKQASQYAQSFRLWWSAYPRKVGKRAASLAFNRAVKRVDLDHLMEKTVEFSESDKAKGEYVPHPKTWLNENRWEDDPAEWRDDFNDDGSGDPEFVKFLKLYPKNGDPIEAYISWKYETKDYPVADILEAVAKFAESDKGNGDFCPSPASWLKNGWYKDDPSRWNEVGKTKVVIA